MNRKIDIMGRLVIPKEMRKQLGINDGDPVHIELKDNQIVLTKPGKDTAEERIEAAIEYIKSLKNFKIKYVMLEEKEMYATENDFVKDLLNILNGE